MKRKNFTLVELLTVIAIIGILAAILIPTVGKARASGEATSCKNNYKQITSAMIALIPTFNGYLPKANASFAYKPQASGKFYNPSFPGGDILAQIDYNMLNSFVVTGDKTSDGNYPVDPKTGTLWVCKTTARRVAAQTDRFGITFCPMSNATVKGREWNYDVLNRNSPSTKPRYKYTSYKLPVGYEEVPMIWESCKGSNSHNKNQQDAYSRVDNPHNDGFNVGYLDGHVETVFPGKNMYLNWAPGREPNDKFISSWR